MPLKDGKPDDVYAWMIESDPMFHKFMDTKDHWEGAVVPWRRRLTIEQKIASARQYTFHARLWNGNARH